MKRERADILVQRHLGVTLSHAQGLIHTGKVFTSAGERLEKPGARVPEDTRIEVREAQRYVSRGGEKLEAALREFSIDVTGAVAIDLGASTGGFTDCLLQHGAVRVYAVDVGYGQIAWRLRQDPRVVVMERTNVRRLTLAQLSEQPNFFTADCSFISLRLILPPLKALLSAGSSGIALIKPQFEASRDQVGKRGVVRDPAVHEQVIQEVVGFAGGLGFHCEGVAPSPLTGPAGNREFLAHFILLG